MDEVKIGIVGVGAIAQEAHLPAYKKAEGIKLNAICDIDIDKAKRIAEEMGVEHCYGSVDEMLADGDIDAVDVCTWNVAHVPVCLKAAEAGKHVMCEKPAAVSVEELCSLKAVLEEKGLVYLLAVPNRFKTESTALRGLFEKGEFGEVYYGKTAYIKRRGAPTGWFCDKRYAGGGCVLDVGVHAIDGAWYIMGEPKPVRVSASTFHMIGDPEAKANKRYISTAKLTDTQYDCEESGSGVIYFENGAQLFFEASNTINGPAHRETVIYGSKAGALLSPPTVYNMTDGYLATQTLDITDKANPFYDEILHFADCVRRGDRNTRYNIDQAITMQKMLNAIYESAEAGKEVIIK